MKCSIKVKITSGECAMTKVGPTCTCKLENEKCAMGGGIEKFK